MWTFFVVDVEQGKLKSSPLRGHPQKRGENMTRTRILVLVVAHFAFAVGQTALAQVHGAHGNEDGEQVREVTAYDIQEKLDGKDAAVTVVEVIIEPGKAGLPHRHPGPGFVTVMEGEYELGINNEPTKIYKAGETFYEPTGCLHSVSRNPSKTTRTRLIAFVLHPRGAKQVAIPEPAPAQ
jgi:quercetin dioxygenase-like cupin family protein